MAQVPFRLAVAKALTAVLAETAWSYDGVDYLMTDSVYRGRVQFGEDDRLPLISILEVPQQPEGSFSGRNGTDVKGTWELVVQGFVTDEFKNPTDPAHYAMAAVKAKLASVRRQANADDGILGFKGLVDAITWNSGVVRPPDETSAVAHFWLTVYLELVEDLSDPFIEA